MGEICVWTTPDAPIDIMGLLQLLLLSLLALGAEALRVPVGVSRRTCLAAALGGASSAALISPRPALADEKKDFEACMSKCVYEATKITKGVGQVEVMGRTEAFAACKPKCAKSKKDLSRGGSRDTVNLNEDGTRKE